MSPSARPLRLAEAPPLSWGRPPLVVDCSAICAVLFDEPERDAALARMLGHTLHAPTLLCHEMLNVALRKRRQGWPEDSVALALAGFDAYRVELRETDARAQYELALRYQLSAFDAAYLWLAGELKSALATFDPRLAQAAHSHLGASG